MLAIRIRNYFIRVALNVIALRSAYWPFTDDAARYYYDWYDIIVGCPKIFSQVDFV